MKFVIPILMIISSLQTIAPAQENTYEIQDLLGGPVRYIKIKNLSQQEINELIDIIFHSDAPTKEKEKALKTLIDAGAIEFEVLE